MGKKGEVDDLRKRQQVECQILLQEWRSVCKEHIDGAVPLPFDGLDFDITAVEPAHLFIYRERLQNLFPHRLHLFMLEIFSAIHTPLLLLLVLGTDDACDRITRFVAVNKVATAKCGEVCKYSAPVTSVTMEEVMVMDSSNERAAEQKLNDAVYVAAALGRKRIITKPK